MDRKATLLNYIVNASRLPGVLDSGQTWISSDAGQSMQNYVVVPFSIKQILFNTEIEDKDQLDSILRELNFKSSVSMAGIRVDGTDSEVVEIEILEIENDEQLQAMSVPEVSFGGQITVRDLFRLALCEECIEFRSENGRLMKIEDAVFGIKNSLSIADDFMPHEIMGMVEGKFPSEPEEFVRNNRFSNGAGLFIIMKESSSGFAGFHAVLPDFALQEKGITYEFLAEKLSMSLEDLSKSAYYSKFELSRILKTLIFQLEFKKQRNLKGPMLNDSTIGILRQNGLIEETEGSFTIAERISPDDLKAMKAEADSSVSSAVVEWHKTLVSI